MKRAPGILFDDIVFRRGRQTIFDKLSLSLAGGGWHAVLGRSGVGKSSLLQLIADLQQAASGEVRADDGEALAPRVAYMAQDDGLLPWLSALDNVQLGYRLRGQRDASSLARAMHLMSRVGLAEWCDARPGVLSGGMRQRVALARTLFEDRPIVLMDEPFSRLDALTRDELQQLAFDLLDKRTVVLVTHDPLEALRLASTITLLHESAPARTSAFTLADSPPRQPDDVAVAALARKLRDALAVGSSHNPTAVA